MQTQNNQSEVARLRDLMDAEREAMRLVMNGFALVAPHEFITVRMERMGTCHDQLVELIGKQKAAEILVQTLQGPSTS